MFRTLIYPSSGACDCVDELPHWSSCSQFVVCGSFWCSWFLARTVNKATDVVIHQHSRKLLKMDILMSETCWAHNKWNKIASVIKLVFHSSTIATIHGPINIKVLLYMTGTSFCIYICVKHFGMANIKLRITCWCVVSLTTWRLYSRPKNIVDIQETKRRSCVCNKKAQRHKGNRKSSRCWIGNGYSNLRSSHFIPMTINDARFTVGCVQQTYSRGGGEEKYFSSAENRITTL